MSLSANTIIFAIVPNSGKSSSKPRNTTAFGLHLVPLMWTLVALVR